AIERVGLPPGHVLWPLLQQIWHFLERYHRARKAESDLEATVNACTELLHALHDAQQNRPAQLPSRRGTPLDGIIFALGQMQQQNQQRRGNLSGPLSRSSPMQ